MASVLEMQFSQEHTIATSGITLGGQVARIEQWPINPDGDPLTLVATIDCRQAFDCTAAQCLPPDGLLYVFSTYSSSVYFLDNITYDGAMAESGSRVSGYTAVVSGCDHELHHSPVPDIPQVAVMLKEKVLAEHDIPLCSLVAIEPPKWAELPPQLAVDYEFFCQFYSNDFLAPFADLFYLTDAVAYLFLRKKDSQAKAPGIFFVGTA